MKHLLQQLLDALDAEDYERAADVLELLVAYTERRRPPWRRPGLAWSR